MTKFTLLGAAALVLSSALASPIMAQDAPRDPAQKQMRMTPHRMHQRHMAYRHDDMTRHNMARRSDVAAGAVGGAVATADAAVNTAGAIATAPFRNDSYAYYNGGPNNGWNNNWNRYDNSWDRQTYAQRNGFVCQSGTWFKGEDGRRHLCQ